MTSQCYKAILSFSNEIVIDEIFTLHCCILNITFILQGKQAYSDTNFNEHLYLSAGVDLKLDFEKSCLEKRLDYVLKIWSLF